MPAFAPVRYRWGRGTPSAGLPAWVTAQTLNTWGTIPASNTLADLNPDNDSAVNPNYGGTAPWRSAGSHAAIVTAWCGAVATPDGRLVWINPGGHNDGYPAASYDLLIDAQTPVYRRLCKPSGAVGLTALDYATEFARGNYQLDANGRHRAQHTLGFQVYWPDKGIATLTGILLANTGGSAATCRPYVSDAATGELVGGLGAAMASSEVGSGSFAGACYDSTRNVAWLMASGTNTRFSRWGGPDSDAWTVPQASPVYELAGGVSLAYCPLHDLVLVGNGGSGGAESVSSIAQTIVGGFGVMDPATGALYANGITGTYPTFSGAPAVNVAWANGLRPGLCQPQWDATLGAFLAWDNATNRTQILRITPPASGDPRTGTWSTDYLAVDGANAVTPSVCQANGTYGRFAVYSDLGICVLVNSVSEAGYFFKYRTA